MILKFVLFWLNQSLRNLGSNLNMQQVMQSYPVISQKLMQANLILKMKKMKRRILLNLFSLKRCNTHLTRRKENKSYQNKQIYKNSQEILKISSLEVNTFFYLDVKFIAELIKIRLIPKKTIKYCIFQLVSYFLEGYYNFFVNNKTSLNFY